MLYTCIKYTLHSKFSKIKKRINNKPEHFVENNFK